MVSVDDQDLADSRHLFDLVEVRGFDFAGEDGHFSMEA